MVVPGWDLSSERHRVSLLDHDVRAAAAAELAAHAALLRARGAATVETALPD